MVAAIRVIGVSAGAIDTRPLPPPLHPATTARVTRLPFLVALIGIATYSLMDAAMKSLALAPIRRCGGARSRGSRSSRPCSC